MWIDYYTIGASQESRLMFRYRFILPMFPRKNMMVLSAADGPHVGTMILAIREKIVHYTLCSTFRCMTSVTGVESLYNVFHVMTSLWVLSDRQMLHVHLYPSHPCHVSSRRTWHHQSKGRIVLQVGGWLWPLSVVSIPFWIGSIATR